MYFGVAYQKSDVYVLVFWVSEKMYFLEKGGFQVFMSIGVFFLLFSK